MRHTLIIIVIIIGLSAMVVFTGQFVETRNYEIDKNGLVKKEGHGLWYNWYLDLISEKLFIPDEYHLRISYKKECPDLNSKVLNDIKDRMPLMDMGTFSLAQGVGSDNEFLFSLHYDNPPSGQRYLTVKYNANGDVVFNREWKR